jgi:hypothetical protein
MFEWKHASGPAGYQGDQLLKRLYFISSFDFYQQVRLMIIT